jgi:uncharacterized membrane protein YfcA
VDHPAAEQAARRQAVQAAERGQQAALNQVVDALAAGGGALAALSALAFVAGLIDAVAGGGGLIQLPALLVFAPQLGTISALGTSKFAGIWGTASAAVQYGRRVPFDRALVVPAGIAALACSFLGARAVAAVGSAELRPLVLTLLVAVLAYTLWKKDFGALHAPKLDGRQRLLAALAIGAAIGFYDGFFGPGTGSFLIFAFIGLLGYSFLAASAAGKIVNALTNVSALMYFVAHGDVAYRFALPMAMCNVAGAQIGSRLAIAKGSGFVRLLFIAIVRDCVATNSTSDLDLPGPLLVIHQQARRQPTG